jgi:hypothetical protein
VSLGVHVDILRIGQFNCTRDARKRYTTDGVHNTGSVVTDHDFLCLAPDIQEEILFLELESGRQRTTERSLRPIAAESDWVR